MNAPTAGPIVTATNLTEVGPGIFYTKAKVVTADAGIVSLLKARALAIPSKRARLCAHPDIDALQHDMLVVSHRDTYVAPHRHLTKIETMVVLEGEAVAVLFDESGEIEACIKLGAAGSGHSFFYRMPAAQYHSLLIDAEFLVFVESTRGPLRKEESNDAPWAPAATDLEAGNRYNAELRARLGL